MKVTYNPAPGDSDVATLFGRVFEAGKALDVTDEQAAKLKGNPTFEVAGEKAPAEDKTREEDDKALSKVLDGRTKAARDAKAKAEAASLDAAAKERAREQVENLARARATEA